jgi:hypothetical protein
MSARNYQNPNGTMSLAYAWHFSMKVKNGILHGERGNRGMGDFYEISGTIAADGTAAIRADGITGKGTEFTKGHRSPGTPFSFERYDQAENYGGRVVGTVLKHSDYAGMARGAWRLW